MTVSPGSASPLEAGVAGLWPRSGWRVSRRPSRSDALVVLPSTRSPRMLVPTGVPGAAQMLSRHSTTRRQRAARAALAVGQRAGLLRLLPIPRLVRTAGGDAGIEELVRRELPGAAGVGVLLGPPRANAKPVLQVFDRDGRTVAFGKVGNSPAAARLVTHEAAVLAELAAATTLVGLDVPRVLWFGEFAGMPVLLMSALSSSQTRRSSWAPPLGAMRSVALSSGTQVCRLSQSDYVAALRSRVAEHDDTRDMSAHDAVEELVRACGDVVMTHGRWHGDWAPWNTGTLGKVVQVWDWERSRVGVPVGFDLAHFLLQEQLRHGPPAQQALDEVTGRLREGMQGWAGPGRPSPEQVAATTLLYLVDIRDRYLTDSGGRPTPRLRARLETIDSMTQILIRNVSKGTHADA